MNEKITCQSCKKEITKKSGYYYIHDNKYICYNCKTQYEKNPNKYYEAQDEKTQYEILWKKAKEILKKLE